MKNKYIILGALAAHFLISPVNGQILKETNTQAIKTAAIAGKIAGGGYFCNVEADSLDEFITLAHARISLEAVDKVDRVVAQLEFSNNYSAWSSRTPDEGCESFNKNFLKKFNEIDTQ